MNSAVVTTPVEVSRVIDASLAEIWTAWTDPDLVSRWFAPGNLRAEVLDYDVRPGGRYRIRMHEEGGGTHTVSGRFLEVHDMRRIVMTWAWEGGEGGKSTVSISFSGTEGATQVDILHEGFRDEESATAHGKGWDGCLDNLGRLISAS